MKGRSVRRDDTGGVSLRAVSSTETRFGSHCRPLDSVNPGFIRRAPLVNPLDSFGFAYRDLYNGPNII